MQEKRVQRTYRLTGDVDHHSAPAIRRDLDRLIDEARPTRLIIDFAGTEIMDSSGIGLLIGRYKKVQRYGGRIYAKNLNRHIRAVFKMAGLNGIIGEIDGRR